MIKKGRKKKAAWAIIVSITIEGQPIEKKESIMAIRKGTE